MILSIIHLSNYQYQISFIAYSWKRLGHFSICQYISYRMIVGLQRSRYRETKLIQWLYRYEMNTKDKFYGWNRIDVREVNENFLSPSHRQLFWCVYFYVCASFDRNIGVNDHIRKKKLVVGQTIYITTIIINDMYQN